MAGKLLAGSLHTGEPAPVLAEAEGVIDVWTKASSVHTRKPSR